MKLLIITAIVAFEKEIKKMLQQAEVKSYSYQEVKGVNNYNEENINQNWFGSDKPETDALLFYAFVKKENVDLFFEKINFFNEKQESQSKIHLAIVDIEKTN